MRTAELWTVQGDHLVFRDILLAGPSENERFFCIRRNDRTDYIPARDILRATVTDDGWTVNKNLKDKNTDRRTRGQNKRVNERTGHP